MKLNSHSYAYCEDNWWKHVCINHKATGWGLHVTFGNTCWHNILTLWVILTLFLQSSVNISLNCCMYRHTCCCVPNWNLKWKAVSVFIIMYIFIFSLSLHYFTTGPTSAQCKLPSLPVKAPHYPNKFTKKNHKKWVNYDLYQFMSWERKKRKGCIIKYLELCLSQMQCANYYNQATCFWLHEKKKLPY